ncbi:J domain-containing protein DDB_G0295729 [Drosophila albomicans]|uniref:J domain-containing protein DDB_G0295729 n=1 Tax=Drosophila albomicans TaxID=7291 RepID=A0A6P8XFW2_DROAB|nr:J domain-containing protein DDB_G0295729 [Drosophila albomicans]
MSYQIKRTPYFRRMFNHSRRNGQLQRLREEYERIQEFNDRTIELKMRQVRLKRLFREIEDINESPSPLTLSASSATRRQQPLLLPLTPEAMQAQQRRERVEALERARELGQEMSRRNAELAENGSGFYLRSELRATAKMRAADEARRDAQERRQRAARRISYGNAQSRSNIERIALRRQRQEEADALLYRHDLPTSPPARLSQQQVLPDQLNVAQPDIVKRSMLQQRLQYGNSRSSNNMMRSQMAAAQRVMNCISGTDQAASVNAHLQVIKQHAQLEFEHRLRNTNTPLLLDTHADNNDSDNDNNNNGGEAPTMKNSNAVNSEDEMQTALLPPTEHEPLSYDDDNMPSTSQNALRLNSDVAAATTTPQPSRLLSATPSERASERWHRISLTLPWLKVTTTHDQHQLMAAASARLPNISISIAGEDVNDSSSYSTPATHGNHADNYQSFRGPSLLQEDLMQIMELDIDRHGQRPYHN